MKIGAHVSIAGGYSEAVKRIANMGGNCMQIFSTSPRGWKPADPDQEEKLKFKEVVEEYSVFPNYFHATYLINLAGSEEIQKRSVTALKAELQTAGDLGISGSIIHLGSFKNKNKRVEDRSFSFDDNEAFSYNELFTNIKEILKDTPKETFFIIENMGTRKIGLSLEEIGYIVENLNDKRVRVCLDTCHLHAAGYDLSTEENLNEFLKRFDELIGLSLLEVVHINDSRDELGSLRDRHENIGEGNIPESVFSLLLKNEKTAGLPFITEAPGFDGRGPDKENIDRIKKLAGVS
ncbi:MAG: deoxyribonuclease IV [Candidatus Paceibacterota bacterium]